MNLIFLVGMIISSSMGGEGVVITSTDSITGEIKIDFQANQITIKDGRNYAVVSARQLKKVKLKDGSSFVAETFGVNNDVLLFELLSEGRVPLLFREDVKINKYDDSSIGPFFIKSGGSLYALYEKKQLFDLFPDWKSEIKNFMKANKIDFSVKSDLRQLMDYCNTN